MKNLKTYLERKMESKIKNNAYYEKCQRLKLKYIDIDDYKYSYYEKKSNAIQTCHSRIIVYKYLNQVNGNIEPKLVPFSSCKDRFCYICRSKKANKAFYETEYSIRSIINKGTEFAAYNLVLTIQNPSIEECHNSLKNLKKTFRNWIKCTPLKNEIIGYIYSPEISISKENVSSPEILHPHIHAIILLKLSRFNANNKKILNEDIYKSQWFKYAQKFGLCSTQFYYKFIGLNVKDKTTKTLPIEIAKKVKYALKNQLISKIPDHLFEIYLDSFIGIHDIQFSQRLCEYKKDSKSTYSQQQKDEYENHNKTYQEVFFDGKKYVYNKLIN